MSADTFMLVLTAAGGVLAFWVCVRFPERGPQSVVPAFAHMIAALILANLALSLVEPAVQIPRAGLYLTLFGLVLAPITYMMISGMWVVRSVLSTASRGVS